ncbi:MAG: HAD family hydrolase [Psychrobium sp.]
MPSIYLFDWGDTLMVDLPQQMGKMCDWPDVKAVKGAQSMLQTLSQRHDVYVATNAADSAESDIKAAFERVGLAQFIKGYFCKANLGIGKGSAEFFNRIAAELNVSVDQLIMVGDTLDKDVYPAIEAGANAIWFNPQQQTMSPNKTQHFRQIHCLSELTST